MYEWDIWVVRGTELGLALSFAVLLALASPSVSLTRLLYFVLFEFVKNFRFALCCLPRKL
jgi:hypothetical protein